MNIKTIYRGTTKTDSIENRIHEQFSSFDTYAKNMDVTVALSVKDHKN